MPSRPAASQVARAFGELLLRSSRAHLYAAVTAGIAGVDATTYPVLSGLARTGPMTATRLAGEIGLDRTVITRHASKLEAAGLLARRSHPTDARATELFLTDRGMRAIRAMRANLDELFAVAMSSWSEAEINAFTRMLCELTDNIFLGVHASTETV